jgi:aspartate aminotransferase-like enzyme
MAEASDRELLLMTPGPTRVPRRVLDAGARPMIHHRTPEFSRIVSAVIGGLQPIFGTSQPVLPVHTTGRGGMEAAIANLFSAGDEVVVCCNGKFGEMWAHLAHAYGLVVYRITPDWNESAAPAQVEEMLFRRPGARAVMLAYSDTSNGVRNDVAKIATLVRNYGRLTLVDGVSSLGGMPFAFDEWEIDVAVTASQKCLMSSPGLAFVVLSERAWAANATAKLPRSYWDLARARASVTTPKPETPGSPPVHVFFQVAEALAMIHEEGLERVFRRHDEMAALTRRRVGELGLSLQCPDLDEFSSTVTAIALPPGLPPRTVRDGLKQRGILTAAGLGKFEQTGFRIGHMGDIRIPDVEHTLNALAEVLSGHSVTK